MSSVEGRKLLFGIAAIDVALLGMGLGISAFSEAYDLPSPRVWLIFAFCAIAIVTFFGLIALEKSSASPSWSLRRPIGATISIVYVIMVIHFSMYVMRGDLPPISSLLLTNFTAIVGVVIAFYFGSSAYIEARRGQNVGQGNGE